MKPLPMLPNNEVIDPTELEALAEATTVIRQNERELAKECESPLTFKISPFQDVHSDYAFDPYYVQSYSPVKVASGILWIQGPMGPSLCYHKPRKQTKPKCRCVVCGAVHNRKGG